MTTEPVQVLRVLEPTAEAIDAAVKLCIDTRGQELVVRNMTGGDPKRLDPFFRSIILGGVESGEFYVALTEETKWMAGCAVWFPPGKELHKNEYQEHFVATLVPEHKEWFETKYRTEFNDFLSNALGPTGRLDSWYLNCIVADHRTVGRDVEKALVKAVVDKARAAGQSLALTATNIVNLAFYEALGFERKGEWTIPGPLGDFQVWAMALKTV